MPYWHPFTFGLAKNLGSTKIIIGRPKSVASNHSQIVFNKAI